MKLDICLLHTKNTFCNYVLSLTMSNLAVYDVNILFYFDIELF